MIIDLTDSELAAAGVPTNSNSRKIVTFLNALIALQPELSRVFDCGIKAEQAVIDSDLIFVRPTVEGDWVTMTGVISQIGRLLGEEIRSHYNIDVDPPQLIGFLCPEDPTRSELKASAKADQSANPDV